MTSSDLSLASLTFAIRDVAAGSGSVTARVFDSAIVAVVKDMGMDPNKSSAASRFGVNALNVVHIYGINVQMMRMIRRALVSPTTLSFGRVKDRRVVHKY